MQSYEAKFKLHLSDERLKKLREKGEVTLRFDFPDDISEKVILNVIASSILEELNVEFKYGKAKPKKVISIEEIKLMRWMNQMGK